MAENKNALAELAERMTVVTSGHGDTWRWLEDVSKARRIVAELAKVSDGGWYDFGHGSKTFVCKSPTVEIGNVIGKCRAIAEERI